MQDSPILTRFKALYPELAGELRAVPEGKFTQYELDFANPRYKLWFMEEVPGSYVVGINFLHAHFDADGPEDNLKYALEYIDDIIHERIVAVGKPKKKEFYTMAVLGKEAGLEKYLSQKPRVEIVSFRTEF